MQSILMAGFRRGYRDYAFGGTPSLSTTAQNSIHASTRMSASSDHHGSVSTRIRLDAYVAQAAEEGARVLRLSTWVASLRLGS